MCQGVGGVCLVVRQLRDMQQCFSARIYVFAEDREKGYLRVREASQQATI
jgi:hypothetical protein